MKSTRLDLEISFYVVIDSRVMLWRSKMLAHF